MSLTEAAGECLNLEIEFERHGLVAMDRRVCLHLQTEVLILDLRNGLLVEAGGVESQRGELAGEAGAVEAGDIDAAAGEVGVAGLDDGVVHAGDDVSCLLVLQAELNLVDGAAVAGVERQVDRRGAERNAGGGEAAAEDGEGLAEERTRELAGGEQDGGDGLEIIGIGEAAGDDLLDQGSDCR